MIAEAGKAWFKESKEKAKKVSKEKENVCINQPIFAHGACNSHCCLGGCSGDVQWLQYRRTSVHVWRAGGGDRRGGEGMVRCDDEHRDGGQVSIRHGDGAP